MVVNTLLFLKRESKQYKRISDIMDPELKSKCERAKKLYLRLRAMIKKKKKSKNENIISISE